ncbi:hypothetical protein LTR36_007603 [Oleoguttula mirabilis]|uniref:Uncharacterized protein n=1 Tax=Oleoguttula mirabilis TaxID=1507867 RepID=A0AAV9JUK8_9PEZI|nr:hypothetical protein LTR36_007603 [Oleoguttula mirabilis]
MPHALTPLGRQLRVVIASLGPTQCKRPPYHRPAITRDLSDTRRRDASARYGGVAKGAAAAQDVDAMYNAIDEQGGVPAAAGRSERPKRPTRKIRKDYLTEAFKNVNSVGLTPTPHPLKVDLSYADAKSRYLTKASRTKAKPATTKHDQMTQLAHMKDLRLERITASLIQHTSEVAKTGQAAWAVPFRLADWEALYVEEKGFNLEDIEAWADIVSTPDPTAAAKALADRDAKPGAHKVPLFVLQYLLRRPYLTAQALRVLLQQSSKLLARRTTGQKPVHIAENTVFTLFIRLLRHAREVWPAAVVAITDILLCHLPRVGFEGTPPAPKQVEGLSQMLNKAMHLLAVPTAIEPFKDVEYQEAAIVKVLRFMTEHQPTLQLNREGYRAVIEVQLAQKKAPSEQQWAELKALSWPPWKQERTAMDSSITAEEHGVSRAGDTLRRMREAGYSATNWEKAAELYAGWDTDRTPTVQTRAILGTGSARYRSGAAIWVARINTTRTAQEAWAAYLAFEDAKLPPSQDVYLAIFQKLYEEERRRRTDPVQVTNRQWRVFPGDGREVEPLPPSTHLYTYTRTPVPTVEGFYRQLRDRHIELHGHCLSFLVANAATLQLGFGQLRSARALQPGIQTLLALDPAGDFESVPLPIFAATVELLCRFSNVSLSQVTGERWYVSRRLSQTAPVLEKQPLNLQHPLVFALELLNLRRTTFRPAWNSVLRALSRRASLSSMSFLLAQRWQFSDHHSLQGCGEAERGALLAYRLVRRVLSMAQTLHVDLDTTGFYHLCVASENAALACWTILRDDVRHVAPGQTEFRQAARRAAVHEANALLRSTSHVTRLTGLFRGLVGEKEEEEEGKRDADAPAPSALPAADAAAAHPTCQEERQADVATGDLAALSHLLAVPSAALLHAYVRALGWLADQEGLLALVRWMVRHRGALAAQRARDRGGEAKLRRVFVALRVFLERSWLARGLDDDDGDDDGLLRGRGLDGTAEGEGDGDGDGDGIAGTGGAVDGAADVLQPAEAEQEEGKGKDGPPTPDLRLKNLRRLERAASADIVREVEGLVNSVEDWPGWPDAADVERYCRDERFERVRGLYDNNSVL